MCIKGTTTTHLRSRWGRVETEEGWWGVRFFTTLPLQDLARLKDLGSLILTIKEISP